MDFRHNNKITTTIYTAAHYEVDATTGEIKEFFILKKKAGSLLFAKPFKSRGSGT